jgi:hypothetical protein
MHACMHAFTHNTHTHTSSYIRSIEYACLYTSVETVVALLTSFLINMSVLLVASASFAPFWCSSKEQVRITHIHMYLCVHMYTYLSVYVYIHANGASSVFTCVCVCVCVCVSVGMYVAVCAYVYVFMHECIHICSMGVQTCTFKSYSGCNTYIRAYIHKVMSWVQRCVRTDELMPYAYKKHGYTCIYTQSHVMGSKICAMIQMR